MALQNDEIRQSRAAFSERTSHMALPEISCLGDTKTQRKRCQIRALFMNAQSLVTIGYKRDKSRRQNLKLKRLLGVADP